jgi:antirestriction protein ArdC
LRGNQKHAQHALAARAAAGAEKERTAMDVYSIITQRISKSWKRVPSRGIGGGAALEHRRILVSKNPYSGINVWLLTAQGYISPYWATIRQINKLGGRVRSGEKSTPVVFWRIYVDDVEVKASGEQHETELEQEQRQGKRRVVLRYYSVFNTEQCELPASVAQELAMPEERALDPIEACEKVLAEMPNPPEIQHAGDKAFYSPTADRITMPPRELFENAEEYWSTFWHEAGHASGHAKRLNRDSINEVAPFGSAIYSIEEIVAEMAAAYLCGITGIENRTIDNSAAYIAGWLRKLRDDRKLIIRAAAQAQRACDYILNHKDLTRHHAQD